ncbi:MAG TPA: DUF2127 domain-containing protein [Candidatus Pristimantibacillus sp.]|nr:DUF2127 domain-containing protein [Candidatus Pristimantibacillus sp.]
MNWFRPKSLLDKAYEIGLFIKGIDGTLELMGGIFLIAVPPSVITGFARFLTQREITDDPHDFVANHILDYGNALAHGQHLFASLFLLTHGAVKVALVIALLRQKLWAYPWALGALVLFLVYQAYLLKKGPSFGMAFLTVLDIIIIWLVWREWQKFRSKPESEPRANRV